MSSIIFIAVIVILAWVYDFFNGANDCANAVATTVSTRALSPRKAILLAATLNIAGAFITTRVAETVGKGIVPSQLMTQSILIACLVGAIIWTFLCTHLGIPISVTHALIGGLIGAAIAAGGIGLIQWGILKSKVLLAMILAPTLGFLAGAVLIFFIFWVFRKANPRKINKLFRKGQIFSASFMALTHGMNDTQNAMGIITAALLAGGFITTFKVPFWVILGSGLFMGLGTYSGGWKVIKTLGIKVAKLQPIHGFAAETASALVIGAQSMAGMPISTTHVISTAVMGGAATQKISGVRWGIARRMVITWILTIPGAAILGGISYIILNVVL